MKKNYIIILAIMLSYSAFNLKAANLSKQDNAAYRMDSSVFTTVTASGNTTAPLKVYYTFNVANQVITVTNFKWATVNSVTGWYLNNKHVYTYDSQGNKATDFYSTYSTTTKIWTYSNKYEYTYDSNNDMLTNLYSTYKSSVWTYSKKYEYTYDGNGNILTNIYSTYKSNVWTKKTENAYTYDANDNQTSETDATWDATNLVWVNTDQMLYTFDANNNQTNETDATWDAINSIWVNTDMFAFVYDTNGNITSETDATWDATNLVWVNTDQMLYTYDSNGNTTNETDASWDATNSVWVNTVKMLYTYDINGNQTNETDSSWDITNSVWVASTKKDYAYDTNGQLSDFLWTYFEVNSKSWLTQQHNFNFSYNADGNELEMDGVWYDYVAGSTTIADQDWYIGLFNYDSNGNLINTSNQNRFTDSGDYLAWDNTNYFYSASTVTGLKLTNTPGKIQFYPNPVKDFMVVTGFDNMAILHIIDLNGKTVLTKTIQSNDNISLSNLQSGMYVLKLNSLKGTKVSKFVKE